MIMYDGVSKVPEKEVVAYFKVLSRRLRGRTEWNHEDTNQTTRMHPEYKLDNSPLHDGNKCGAEENSERNPKKIRKNAVSSITILQVQ